MSELLHGRPQWVCRVRRSSTSSDGFVLLVTASTLGLPKLHDPTGSLCLAPPKARFLQPPVGPLAPVAPPVLQITAPDNDASAAAEPLLNTLLSYSQYDREQAAPRRRQSFYEPIGVHKLTTSAYSPCGNGGVDRVYHTMATIPAMICNERQNNWDAHLFPRCTRTHDKRLLPEW